MTSHDVFTMPEIERLLRSRSQAELFSTWWRHRKTLKGYRLLLSVPGETNVPLPTSLNLPDGGFLRSLLKYERIIYLDNHIVRQTARPGGAQIAQDFSITFDTQIIRYLALAVEGSSNPVAQQVKATLAYLSTRGWNWDFWPFIEENADRMSRAEVYANQKFRDNLRAVEIVKDLDEPHFLTTGHLRPRSSDRVITARVDRLLQYAETRPPALKDYYRQWQRLMYAVLLAVASIQLRVPRRPVRDKLLELLDFFHEDLNAMMARELRYGATLFEDGQRSGFFGRVQRSRQTLLKDLINMSWDLLIARRMEQHIGVGSRGGMFYLPYLLTFDQDLVKLMDTFRLRGALLLPSGEAVSLPDDDLQPLFQKHGLAPDEVLPYFSPEARQYRARQHAVRTPDIERLIERLEDTLAKV